MTRHIGLAALAACLLATSPPDASATQRSRTVPPSDAADGGDARKAQPREAEPRRAEPRPAEAPAAEAPAAKTKIEAAAPAPAAPPSSSAPARESSHQGGPVVVTPTVVVPSTVGGVTVGKSFSVGSTFSVGHDAPDPDTSSQSDGRRRRDRPDYSDRSVETVIVPVPVYVSVDDSAPPSSFGSASATSSASLADVARASRRVNVPRSYFTFTPWYNVGGGIVAGYPVPLPPPSAFTEGNISATVADTRHDTNGTTDTVSVVDYAKGVGGVAFAVTPAEAGVYVDGRFVGSVADYSPQREPLLLQFGVYNVELRARGYVTEKFAAYVTMGEVVPFSGMMTKAEP